MSTTAIDEAKLEQFMGQMVGHMTGAAACLSIWLGDELGLYRTLARGEARSAENLAAETGCNPRLVREWLHGQTPAGAGPHGAGGGPQCPGARGRPGRADAPPPGRPARALR